MSNCVQVTLSDGSTCSVQLADGVTVLDKDNIFQLEQYLMFRKARYAWTKGKRMNIILNGVEMGVPGIKLYYKDICNYARQPEGATVTWRYTSGVGGSLTAGSEDGVYLDSEQPTIFNCVNTSRS